jgi:hypothetical protein
MGSEHANFAGFRGIAFVYSGPSAQSDEHTSDLPRFRRATIGLPSRRLLMTRSHRPRLKRSVPASFITSRITGKRLLRTGADHQLWPNERLTVDGEEVVVHGFIEDSGGYRLWRTL